MRSGQHLGPLADVLDARRGGLVGAGREAQLEDLAGRVRLDQLAGRALGDDAALVHHDEAVAELLGLVHVVGRQHERDALLLEPVQAVPQDVAGLRVETGGRLVEEQQLGVVDQRAGDRHPPLHPARQRVDLARGPFRELHEVEQLGRAALALGPREVEVAAVDDQVLGDGQLVVELVGLRHDAEAGPDLAAVRGGLEAEHPQRPGGRRRRAADHPHRRGLAGPVRPEEPERLAAVDLDVDAVDRREVAEPLDELARLDQRFAGHDPRTYRRALPVLVRILVARATEYPDRDELELSGGPGGSGSGRGSRPRGRRRRRRGGCSRSARRWPAARRAGRRCGCRRSRRGRRPRRPG